MSALRPEQMGGACWGSLYTIMGECYMHVYLCGEQAEWVGVRRPSPMESPLPWDLKISGRPPTLTIGRQGPLQIAGSWALHCIDEDRCENSCDGRLVA